MASHSAIVIPAHFGSKRFPGKILAPLRGKPMIQWVIENCLKVPHIDGVYLATDHPDVMSLADKMNVKAFMTSDQITSGTERMAAVAPQIEADYLVNVQADEPFLKPQAIEAALEKVVNRQFPMATLMTPIRELWELEDPSTVKVIADQKGRAIYFSRFPIPYSRASVPSSLGDCVCRRHVGLYAMNRETLLKFQSLPPSPLEKAEVLEQLKALEHGIPIGITEVPGPILGVDTPEDLEKAERLLV